jgi:hypothetical protein
VIVLYAQKTEANPTSSSMTPLPSSKGGDIARRFAGAFDGWTGRYRRVCAELTRDGRQLAAYGAGHLTCAFLNFHGLADHFAFVVDDTPQKQGLFLPTARLPIVPRTELSAEKISACLFGLTPQIENKVIANNADYAESGGRFYSMFVDSPRSIRHLVGHSM